MNRQQTWRSRAWTLTIAALASLLGAVSFSAELLPEHREQLGLDLLEEEGAGLQKDAWPGTVRTRLGIANELYCESLSSEANAGQTQAHLESPLLGKILGEAMALLGSEEKAAEDPVVGIVDKLSTHLKGCVENGGSLKGNKHLRAFETWLAGDLLEKLEIIPGAPDPSDAEAATMGATRLAPETKAAIERFVTRLTLALKLRDILPPAGSEGLPGYLKEAVRGLREKVFGLDGIDSFNPEREDPLPTLYWDKDVTEFRAQVFQEISNPLHDCLSRHKDLEQALFDGIVLVLVRVHGFLKTSQSLATGEWEILPWLDEKEERYEQLFRVCDTDRWLDADDALLELAKRRLTYDKDAADPWTIEPKEVFAGHFNKNANLRVWRKLLAEGPKADQRANWCLMDIAKKAVELLQSGLLPNGPAFGEAIPPSDTYDDVWDYAAWLDSVVTAAEWDVHPLARNRAWYRDTPKSGLTVTGEEKAPFKLLPPEIEKDARREWTRRVDGKARLRLLDALTETESGMERCCTLAGYALFLPNHEENNTGDADFLERAEKAKYKLQQQLAGYFDNCLKLEEISEQSTQKLLRMIMLLEVSRRKPAPADERDNVVPADTCAFEAVCARSRAWIDDRKKTSPHNAAKLDGWTKKLQNDRLDLLRILQGGPDEGKLADRGLFDKRLAILLPEKHSPEHILMQADFAMARIETLDAGNVQNLLGIRNELKKILDEYREEAAGGNVAGPAEEDAALMEADLKRIRDLLNLFNYALWYTRPDLDVNIYLDNERGQDNDVWYPAFLALAWYDRELQQLTRDALEIIESRLPERPSQPPSAILSPNGLENTSEAGAMPAAVEAPADASQGSGEDEAENGGEEAPFDVIDTIYWRLYQLNEVISTSVLAASEHAKAKKMLDFEKEISEELYDFRLLIKNVETDPLKPEKLCENALAAVAVNLAIVQRQTSQKPSDEAVYARLFDTGNQDIPPLYQRSGFAPTPPAPKNLDGAISKAIEWQETNLDIAALGTGAELFLTGDGKPDKLLDGVATPEGIMCILDEVLRRTAEAPSNQYGAFFDAQFTTETEPAFNEYFKSTMASVFFTRYDDAGVPMPVPVKGGELDSQRARTEQLLVNWASATKEGEPHSRLERAYWEAFPGVIGDLIMGERRPEGAEYIWEPAARMEQDLVRPTEEGAYEQWSRQCILEEPPAEFLDLFNWLAGLEFNLHHFEATTNGASH